MEWYNDTEFEITEETVAAWLDGTLSENYEREFAEKMSSDPLLGEILDAMDDVENDFENITMEGYELPADLVADFDLPEITLPWLGAEDSDTDGSNFPQSFHESEESDESTEEDTSDDTDAEEEHNVSGEHDDTTEDLSSDSSMDFGGEF